MRLLDHSQKISSCRAPPGRLVKQADHCACRANKQREDIFGHDPLEQQATPRLGWSKAYHTALCALRNPLARFRHLKMQPQTRLMQEHCSQRNPSAG